MTRIAGLFFALLFLGYGYLASDVQLDFWAEEETFNARTFPYLIAAGGCFFAVLLSLFGTKTIPTDTEVSAKAENADVELRNAPALFLIVLMLAYSYLLEPLGFPVATAAFLAGAFVILGERRKILIGCVSVGLTAGIWAIMSALGIYLEPGVLSSLLQ